MTFTRLHITVFLGAAVMAWAGTLYFQGVAFTWAAVKVHLAPFSTVVGVLFTIALLLERVLWRLPVLHGWFVKRPDLRGTWKVTLQSDWRDPETGERIPPVECFMGVTQSLSTLQMHLMTPESESWLIADQIRASPNGAGYQIVGVYTNKPDVHLRGVRSEMHYGAFVFDTHGAEDRPASLAGEYWTDRRTTGRMILEGRIKELHTHFEGALAAFERNAD